MMWLQSLHVMNIQCQNTSRPPWARLPVRIDVFETVLEDISFEQAKNVCVSSFGTIYVGECENVLFSLVMPTERMAWQLLWQYYQPLHKICSLSAIIVTGVLFCMHSLGGLMSFFHDICLICNQWCCWDIKLWSELWSPCTWRSESNASDDNTLYHCSNLMVAYCSSFKVNNFDGKFSYSYVTSN